MILVDQCVLSQEPGYVVYSTVGSFYIPLVVMFAVYLKIFHVTRARARRNLSKSTKLPSQKQPHVTELVFLIVTAVVAYNVIIIIIIIIIIYVYSAP